MTGELEPIALGGDDIFQLKDDRHQAVDAADARVVIDFGSGRRHQEEAGDTSGRVVFGVADTVFNRIMAAATEGDGGLVIGKGNFALGETVAPEPCAGHLDRFFVAGGENLDMILAEEFDHAGEEFLGFGGGHQHGGGAVGAVDPFANFVGDVQPGGIDEGAFGKFDSEVRRGGDRQRTRVFGHDAVKIDGDVQPGGREVPIRRRWRLQRRPPVHICESA